MHCTRCNLLSADRGRQLPTSSSMYYPSLITDPCTHLPGTTSMRRNCQLLTGGGSDCCSGCEDACPGCCTAGTCRTTASTKVVELYTSVSASSMVTCFPLDRVHDLTGESRQTNSIECNNAPLGSPRPAWAACRVVGEQYQLAACMLALYRQHVQPS